MNDLRCQCHRCGWLGRLPCDSFMDEGGQLDLELIGKEWSCPTCGQKLHVHVGALVETDESCDPDLNEEGI